MNTLTEIPGQSENRPSRFKLDLSVQELGLLSDLLSSVKDSRASHLRQTIQQHIRSNILFDLRIHKSIVLCNNCSGVGNVQYWDDFLEEYIYSSCRKCKSTGRRIQFTTIRYEPLSGGPDTLTTG